MNNIHNAEIDLILDASIRDLGDFDVRRALPAPQRRSVGPFVFFDEFGPVTLKPGKGFDTRPHPHIGLATLSYLLEGEMVHRDSEGFVQTLHPGSVNLMTAGQGIVHSERSTADFRANGGGVHGFQTWIALPAAQENIAPDFQHVPANAIPEMEGEGISLKLLAGSLNHRSALTRTFSETLYADVALQQGARFRIDDHHIERAAYVISGKIGVTGQTGEFSPGQMVVFKPGSEIVVKAAHDAARVIVLGGEPLDGKRHIFWNFVASRKERIEQAAEDWRAGRFKTVPGETEFIPLPESKPLSSGK